jgi:hypothetical protein
MSCSGLDSPSLRLTRCSQPRLASRVARIDRAAWRRRAASPLLRRAVDRLRGGREGRAQRAGRGHRMAATATRREDGVQTATWLVRDRLATSLGRAARAALLRRTRACVCEERGLDWFGSGLPRAATGGPTDPLRLRRLGMGRLRPHAARGAAGCGPSRCDSRSSGPRAGRGGAARRSAGLHRSPRGPDRGPWVGRVSGVISERSCGCRPGCGLRDWTIDPFRLSRDRGSAC